MSLQACKNFSTVKHFIDIILADCFGTATQPLSQSASILNLKVWSLASGPFTQSSQLVVLSMWKGLCLHHQNSPVMDKNGIGKIGICLRGQWSFNSRSTWSRSPGIIERILVPQEVFSDRKAQVIPLKSIRFAIYLFLGSTLPGKAVCPVTYWAIGQLLRSTFKTGNFALALTIRVSMLPTFRIAISCYSCSPHLRHCSRHIFFLSS